MKVDGIEIPDNAKCEFFGSPYGTDLSRVARLYVHNGTCRPERYHIIELSSELDENDLAAERCKIEFVENQNGNEEGVYAEITSGKFKGIVLFLKIQKENENS